METNDTPKPFFPEQEVKNILKAPSDERKEKLSDFKERYFEQKKDLAEVYDKMAAIIRQSPDDHYDNYGHLKTLLDGAGASPEQAMVGTNAFGEYMKKHNAVSDIRKKYPDDAVLYKAIFKKAPRGKVEVITGPMTLYFKCSNVVDYARIFSDAPLQNREITAHDIDTANNSRGVSKSTSSVPGLEGCIIAENTSLITSKYKNDPEMEAIQGIHFESKGTQDHEEQHAIKKLFEDEYFRKGAFDKISSAKNEKERLGAVVKTFRYDRERIADSRAKDEILAYFKENMLSKIIYDSLTKPKSAGGIYDYWEEYKLNTGERFRKEWKDMLKDQKIRPLIDEAEKKVFKDEYHKLIENSIRNAYFLYHKGYTEEQVIGLLVNEPLSKWAKVVGRLVEGERIAKDRK